MANYNIMGPSLIYPMGNETILTKEIDIIWEEPSTLDNLVWIEILYTDNFERKELPDWKQIALIPSSVLTYKWTIPTEIKGNKCRIGVRAVNYKGERSIISFSANDFSIKDKILPIPAVIEPIANSSYFSYVPIILDKKGIIGHCSQRAFYNVYYSSDSQKIDWTLLKASVPIDSGPIYWDVKNLNTASDYEIRIELADADNVSEPVFIKNITINGLNYFLIDTVPPNGRIRIINNQDYTKDKDIVVQLTAFDETTGVEYFQIEQLDLTGSSSSSIQLFEKMTSIATWHIKGDDGQKLIQAKFKDYAGNVLNGIDNRELFRTYKSSDDSEAKVTAVVKDSSYNYFAFSGTHPVLYKNKTAIANLSGTATAMAFFDDILYIAINNGSNVGILQKLVAGEITTIANMSTQSVEKDSQVDCVINSMAVYDGKLFLGLQNGYLYSYNGATIALENSSNVFDKSINKIYGNNICLFVFLDNSETITVMTKTTNGYSFSDKAILN